MPLLARGLDLVVVKCSKTGKGFNVFQGSPARMCKGYTVHSSIVSCSAFAFP